LLREILDFWFLIIIYWSLIPTSLFGRLAVLTRCSMFWRPHLPKFCSWSITRWWPLGSFKMSHSSLLLNFLYIILGRRWLWFMFHGSTVRNVSFSSGILKFSLAMRTLSHTFIILYRDRIRHFLNLSFLLTIRNVRVLFDFLNLLRSYHSLFKNITFGSPVVFFLFTICLFWSFFVFLTFSKWVSCLNYR